MVNFCHARTMITEEALDGSSRFLTSFAVRARVVFLAAFCAWLTLVTLGEARAAQEVSVLKLGDALARLDPDKQVPEAVDQLAAAGCSVNMALSAIFQGDNGALVEIMRSAADEYGAGAGVLEPLVAGGGFQEEFSEQLKSFLHLTGLFSAQPTKQADLLARIAVLAREAEVAARRIAQGEGGDGDLTVVVQRSADITRLIALFFQVLVA